MRTTIERSNQQALEIVPSISGIRLEKLTPRIRNVVESLLRSELRSQLKPPNIARSLQISTYRFQHLFKNEVGVSFGRWVKLLRLHRARELFQTSSHGVKEVAASVGISDLSHFCRDYKQVFGETPSQTRKISRRGSMKVGARV